VGFIGIFVSPSDSWSDRIWDAGGIPVMVSSFCFSAWRLALVQTMEVLAIDQVGLTLLSEDVWSDLTHTDTSAIVVPLVVDEKRGP
jgi:hypothetical protein